MIAAAAALGVAFWAGNRAHAAAPPTARTSAVYVHAGTLIDGTDAAPRSDMALVLEGDRIASVGPWSAARPPAGAVVVDLSRLTVLPGLIDAHVHLSMTIGPGWENVPVRDDIADAAIEATVNAARTLRAGFTTVRNVGDFAGESVALREAIDAGRIEGPHVQTARSMGVEPIIIRSDPLAVPDFRRNAPDRCYVCKRVIFTARTFGSSAASLTKRVTASKEW